MSNEEIRKELPELVKRIKRNYKFSEVLLDGDYILLKESHNYYIIALESDRIDIYDMMKKAMTVNLIDIASIKEFYMLIANVISILFFRG